MRVLGCIFVVFFTMAFLSCSDDDGPKGDLIVSEPATPTLLVTNYSDSGPGTLREVISNAPSGAVIGFSNNILGVQLTVSLTIDKDITIYGGSNAVFPIYGGNLSCFAVNTGCHVVLANLRLCEGQISSVARGAAISNNGTVTLQNSQIDNNHAMSGGAIVNSGTMNMYNCLFLTNSAGNRGGAIYSTGVLNIVNCTFVGNSSVQLGGVLFMNGGTAQFSFCTVTSNFAGSQGGAVCRYSGTLKIRNSIFANNKTTTSVSQGYNIWGTVDSLKYTLVEVTNKMTVLSSESNIYNTDPQLQNFGNNGGLSGTFALNSTSPAKNAGDSYDCNGYTITNDQRGESRPKGSAPDMGAFEYIE